MDFLDDSPILRDPHRREEITQEHEPSASCPDGRFPDVDWMNTQAQGHGSVPADFEWTSNPKQDQDDLEGGG